MGMKDLKPVFDKAAEVARTIREHLDSTFMIVSHYDADGLSSALIMAKALTRLGARFQLRIVDQLDLDEVKKSLAVSPPTIVFTDLGSGYKDMIVEELEEAGNKRVIIIDHHEPREAPDSEKLLELNPHRLGLDGSLDASSATLSYLVAKTLDENNVDLIIFMVAGALGDRQDCGERRSLCSLNAELVREAEELGYIEARIRPMFPGSPSTPVVRAIANMVDPYIPGLSGDESAVYAFLKEHGISPEDNGRLRALRDLSEDEARTITSLLVLHMLSKGLDAKEAEKMLGYDYIKPDVDVLASGREMASFLNACGRLRMPWYPFAIFGEGWPTLDQVENVLGEYRLKLARGLEWVWENKENFPSLRYVVGVPAKGVVEDRLIGVIISLSMGAGMLEGEKVVVGFAYSDFREGQLKVSCRSPRSLVDMGVDLGKAVKVAAERVGGLGGGHDAAAGAQIPDGSEDEFLRIVDEIVGAQLAGA